MYILPVVADMVVVTDKNRFVLSPEKLTIKPISPVISLGIHAVQISHDLEIFPSGVYRKI
jgi:hypothetical protein